MHVFTDQYEKHSPCTLNISARHKNWNTIKYIKIVSITSIETVFSISAKKDNRNKLWTADEKCFPLLKKKDNWSQPLLSQCGRGLQCLHTIDRCFLLHSKQEHNKSMAQNKPTHPLAFKALELKPQTNKLFTRSPLTESLLQYVLWHNFSAFHF